jgi:hypothetical protein
MAMSRKKNITAGVRLLVAFAGVKPGSIGQNVKSEGIRSRVEILAPGGQHRGKVTWVANLLRCPASIDFPLKAGYFLSSPGTLGGKCAVR